jgi:hypothetical protein
MSLYEYASYKQKFKSSSDQNFVGIFSRRNIISSKGIF